MIGNCKETQRNVILPPQIQEAIDSGDFCLNPAESWHLTEEPYRNHHRDIAVLDAFALGFIDWTEQGRANNQERERTLRKKLGIPA